MFARLYVAMFQVLAYHHYSILGFFGLALLLICAFLISHIIELFLLECDLHHKSAK